MELIEVKEKCIDFMKNEVDKIIKGNLDRVSKLFTEEQGEVKLLRFEDFLNTVNPDKEVNELKEVLEEYLKREVHGESFRAGLASEFMEHITISLLISDFFIDAAEAYVNQE